MNILRCPLCVASLALAVLAVPSSGIPVSGHQTTPVQTLGKRAPLRPITSIAGKDLYKAYCEQCHGADGRGNGPAAASLKKAPIDLTQIAARGNGRFDRAAVEAFIKGDRPGAGVRADKGTGSPVVVNPDGTYDEMPVFGLLFHRFWPEDPLPIRIGNLARYVESIQAK